MLKYERILTPRARSHTMQFPSCPAEKRILGSKGCGSRTNTSSSCPCRLNDTNMGILDTCNCQRLQKRKKSRLPGEVMTYGDVNARRVCDPITMRTWTRLPVVEFQTFSVRLLAAVITVLSWRSHATMVTFSFVTLSSSGGGLYFLPGSGGQADAFVNVKGKRASAAPSRRCPGADHDS